MKGIPPDRIAQWVKDHRVMLRQWLKRLSVGPVLSFEIEQELGLPSAIATGEDAGFCLGRCIERHKESSQRSVYRWDITDRGREWLSCSGEKMEHETQVTITNKSDNCVLRATISK